MSSAEPSTPEKADLSPAEVERLLAQVAEGEAAAGAQAPNAGGAQVKNRIEPYDFRSPVLLSAGDLRKLRLEHEAFLVSLAARLSIHLRLEFALKLAQLETRPYQKFVQSLAEPCHLTLFKVEPLRGICILEMPPRLGFAIIDRLMGGPGQPSATPRDLSEVEMALLDQALQLILSEWCGHWSKFQELRPTLLGHENTGRFLQTSAPEAVMLAVSIEARMGDCSEQIQIGFPYTTLEPLVRALSSKLKTGAEGVPHPPTQARPKWKREFDDLLMSVNATGPGIKLTARQLAKLKVGDVIPLPSDFANAVRLRLAGTPRFLGRLGTSEQHWAIELTALL
jgi:flagellar motor switch protein FliM